MSNQSKGDVVKTAIADTGGAVVGGIVGFAVGGVPGAMVGTGVAPAASAAMRIAGSAALIRIRRAGNIVEDAADEIGTTSEGLETIISKSEEKILLFESTISDAVESDKELDDIYALLLADLALAEAETQLDRVRLIADALKNLRRTHMAIIRVIAGPESPYSPDQIADELSIPATELRGAVRLLEMNGVIKDVGDEHTAWEIRELGTILLGVANRIKTTHNTDGRYE